MYQIAGAAAAETESLCGWASGKLPASPSGACYEIADEFVPLDGGTAETRAAPGSATKARTQVFDAPVFGDLDADGDDDANLWLVQQPGGSGTFYYVAAAINESGGFRGTKPVLLGDRIAPRELLIEHRVVTARFADRQPAESMATYPTVESTRHFTVASNELALVLSADPGETLMHGWLVIGHEVRTFQPCIEGQPLWLAGSSLSITSLARAYRKALPGTLPYTPVFVTIVGHQVAAPTEGYGADYAGSFKVRGLVQVWPTGNCIGDRVVVETPVPGSTVISPVTVRGKARGAWFFEGEVTLQLLDRERNVLAQGFATAQSNWMTNDFVPFEGTLTFESRPDVTEGMLVVKRNNPSDNRDLDEAMEFPVVFR
jgi:hypothetical protein